MDVLLVYDIADTEEEGALRLRQVAQVCERYGCRVQKSVFECRLSPTRLARMIGEIQDAIDGKRDSVIVYRFAGSLEDAREHLGRSPGHEIGQPWIV